MKYKDSVFSGITLILVIAVVVLFANNNSLKSDIQLLEGTVYNKALELEQEISSIYGNVDEQLKKQASLFSQISYDFGTFDSKNNIAYINISLVPKASADNMSISIRADGKVTTLSKKEDMYTGEIPVGLFLSEVEHPLAWVTYGGETKTEYLQDLSISDLWVKYLPSISAGAVVNLTNTKYKNDSLNIDIILDISYTNTEYKFTKFSVVAKVNDKEVNRKDITDELLSIVDDSGLRFQENYKMSESDTLTLYIEAEDELGFIHEIKTYHWQQNDGAMAEVMLGDKRILDKDNNVLFSGKK